jgi:hypothetical protein
LNGREVKVSQGAKLDVLNRINQSETSDISRTLTLHVEVLLEGAARSPSAVRTIEGNSSNGVCAGCDDTFVELSKRSKVWSVGIVVTKQSVGRVCLATNHDVVKVELHAVDAALFAFLEVGANVDRKAFNGREVKDSQGAKLDVLNRINQSETSDISCTGTFTG